MPATEIEQFQNTHKDCWRQESRVSKKVERPKAGDRSECDFKAARPVNANLRRVCINPTIDMSEECADVLVITCIPVGPTQGREILKPIQLPGNFLVPRYRRIQIINPAPMLVGIDDSRNRCEMPLYRIAEVKIMKAE